jgi:hypothetical protein
LAAAERDAAGFAAADRAAGFFAAAFFTAGFFATTFLAAAERDAAGFAAADRAAGFFAAAFFTAGFFATTFLAAAERDAAGFAAADRAAGFFAAAFFTAGFFAAVFLTADERDDDRVAAGTARDDETAVSLSALESWDINDLLSRIAGAPIVGAVVGALSVVGAVHLRFAVRAVLFLAGAPDARPGDPTRCPTGRRPGVRLVERIRCLGGKRSPASLALAELVRPRLAVQSIGWF